MKLSHKYLNWYAQIIKSALIGVCSIFFAAPSSAFIPIIYEPNPQELKKTGISIGKTAAQFIQLGKPKEAVRLASLAVSIQPKDDRLWAILAEAQIRTNNLEAASLSLATAKKLNPKKAGIWFAEASLALQQKKSDKAADLLIKGLSLKPDNAIAYFQLGNARIMQLKFQLALNSFEKAIKLQPQFWEAQNNQAIVFFELRQKKNAIKAWQNVLNIELNAEPMLALAAALNQLQPGNSKSLTLAKQALAKNPNYVSSKYQKEQLWGKELRNATKQLISRPELQSTVERARAKSDIKNDQAQ